MVRMKQTTRSNVWAYIFLAPVIIGMTLFSLMPIIMSFGMSTFDWVGFSEPNFIGIGNYIKAFKDSQILKTIINTFRMAIIILPVSLLLSTLIAVGLNNISKGKGLYRIIYYLPVITMPAAIAMVWRVIFDYKYGVLNFLAQNLGFDKIPWLGDPNIAWISITIISIWGTLGTQILILTASLQSVSMELYEAAEMDGASPIKRFFSITIPMLSPTLFFLVISGFVALFQLFDVIYIMIGRGIGLEKTKTIVYYFYDTAFQIQDKGYGATIAVIIFFTILIFTGVQFLLEKKWVYHE